MNPMKAITFRVGSNIFDKQGALYPRDIEDGGYHERVYFEKDTFVKMTEAAGEYGFDTIVLNLAEGIVYDSHPELAIEGSMPKSEFRRELERLRKLGFKAVPMLDFSPATNAWMGKYANMVGTEKYYTVCDELLAEVIDLFDTPEYFHLGYDSESFDDQKNNPVIFTRHATKRIADVNRLINICREKGVRPWLWVSPEIIESYGGEEMFVNGIPKDVVLTALAYKRVQPYHVAENRADKAITLTSKLAKWGYPQIPMASTWRYHASPSQVMWYYKNFVDNEKFEGMLCHPSIYTVERRYYWLLNDMQRFNQAYNEYVK